MPTIFLCCAFMLLGLGVAGADPLQSTDPAAVLRDPSPQDSHEFSHTAANGGTADVGRELGAVPVAQPVGCKAANPCALPSAPLMHVAAPPPSRPE